jgi:NADPH:quinone reductase-like Zn-dependent oxidoreductase
MSRVVRFYKTGGPEVLQISDEQVTAPGAGEVQIEVKAIGINRAEVMFRSGQYLEMPQLPARLGYEAAGIVVSVDEGVSEFKPGDAVSTVPAFSQNEYGVYGDLVNVPATAVVKHPVHLSWPEAAAIWMQYMTAYGALVDIADTKADEYVLISAASSSVGVAAIQTANMIGAIPVALTRYSSKREALLKAGAKYVIATEEQDLVAEVNRITNGHGARVIFDPVGGPTINKLAEATAQRGIIFQYGALSSEPTPLPLFTILAKQLTIRGYTLFEVSTDPERFARAKQFIIKGLSDGKLKPAIAKIFKLEQVVEAHRYMQSNQHIGKIILEV